MNETAIKKPTFEQLRGLTEPNQPQSKEKSTVGDVSVLPEQDKRMFRSSESKPSFESLRSKAVVPAPGPAGLSIPEIADPNDVFVNLPPAKKREPVTKDTTPLTLRPFRGANAGMTFPYTPNKKPFNLGILEIGKAIRELVAPTTPYTEKEAIKAYKEIPRTLENAGMRVLTLGGLAGPLMGLKPSELRAALDEDVRDSAGFAPALAPALGETALLAVEWGYIYPKLFKAVGAAPVLIAKIPGVAKGAKALKALGGIEKIATKYPRLYNKASKGLAAFTKGATVGTITALPEALGEELPAGEVLKHTSKSAAIMGGVALTFQALSQIDTARYVKQLRTSLIKASNQKFTVRITELKSTLPPRQANEAIKGLVNTKRLELQNIDNIVSAAEAQLIGLKQGKLYQKGQGMVESPQKAAERFIRQGIGAGKPFEGEPLLKKGLGKTKPFIEMPTTRAGEIRESVVEAAKTVRHPVKALQKAGITAQPPSLPKAPAKAPGVLPVGQAPVEVAEVMPQKRQQAIDFVRSILSQEQYAALDEKARIEIGQKMLAEQGVEVTAEELAETPPTVPTTEPEPTPTGRKAAEAGEVAEITAKGKAEIVELKKGEQLPITKEPIMAFKLGEQIIYSKEATIHAEIPLTKEQDYQVVTLAKDPAGFIFEGKFYNRDEWVALQKVQPPTEAKAGAVKAVTPAMKQYTAFKKKYPDTVILMKMGDFYEAFGEDAKVLNKVLGTTMTKRGDTPMAGVPYHAIDSSLKKIIQAGHKVAVVEEVSKERAAEVGKEIQRDVVRIVTPSPKADAEFIKDRWDNSKLGYRVELVMRGKWITNKGQITRSGEKYAESKWDELSPAVQNVVRKFIAQDYNRQLPGATVDKTAEIAPKVTALEKKAEPTKVEKEIKYEKEAITEPTPSPQVEPRQARKFVPTGKLDPTNAKEALEITKEHAHWVGWEKERTAWEGINTKKWDSKAKKNVIDSVIYTPEQVDTAYRTIQKPVESPMPDVELFAMPGKEVQVQAIAQKMAKVKGVVKPKKMGPKPLTKPTALPKAKTKIEDHIKAVYGASAKEDVRYPINGVKVEGDIIVATDGRRMFWAKGKWGKDGIYLNPASLKKGVLGKSSKPEHKFPNWRDIVPDVSDQKPILVPSGGVYEDLDTVLRRVRQAASITTEESRGIIIIENKDGSLGFAAAAPEVGHVEINVNPGGKILGAANPRYLLDVIKFHAIRGDRGFEFYLSDPTRPILTKSFDGKTNTLTMPINVGEEGPGTEAIAKAISEGKPPAQVKPKPEKKVQVRLTALEHLAKEKTKEEQRQVTRPRGDWPGDTIKKRVDKAFRENDLVELVRLRNEAKGEFGNKLTMLISEVEYRNLDKLTMGELRNKARYQGVDVNLNQAEMIRKIKEARKKKPKPKGGGAIGDIGVSGATGIDTGRIKVSMEPGAKPQTARDIIDYMSRAFGIVIRGKATHRKQSLGWFDPKATGIRLKDVRSLTTGTHEVAHHIDWTLNNRMSLNPPSKQIADELMALGRALYGNKKPPGGYKSEGWAEFVREYLTGEEAEEKAPNLYKWFTKEYLSSHKDMAKKIARTREMITKWRLQGAEARVDSQINKKQIKGPFSEWFKRGLLWVETSFRDEFAPIKRAMIRAGIREGELTPAEDPYQIAVARADKAGAVARQFVLEYTTDMAGNRTGKGLREILKPVAKEINTFTRWIITARARLLHKKGINPGISKADADYVYEKYDNEIWQDTLKELTTWNHRVLDYLVEAGGLDTEAANTIKKSNPIYIPFMRAFKEGELRMGGGYGKGLAKVTKPIKKIKGSGREIIDPIESMIKQTQKIIAVAHKAEIAKAIANLATKKGVASMIWKVPAPKQAVRFEAEQLKKDIARIAYERMGLDPQEISSAMLEHWDDVLTVYSNAGQYYGKDNIVALVINGKQEWYEVDPALYKAIEGVDQYTLPWFLSITFGKATRMVRLGATGLNPAFGLIRNFIRDAMTFTVLSKHAKAGPLSAVKGIVEDIIDTPSAKKFKAMGGKMSSQILADRRAVQNLKKHVLASTVAGKTIYTVAHPIDALRELFGVTEAGTRIGEYGPALKAAEKKYGKGSKDAAIYALNQAQDVTTNFSRHGKIAKVLNQMIPFFNAAIQGPDKIMRTFGKRPVATSLKAILALTIPAIWSWWKYKDEEWYKNMPVYERVNYLHFRIPGTETIIRLPVPFELGHIFQSAPIAALDSWYRKDPKIVNEMFKESLRQANPFDWPATFRPIIDIMANEDFAGRPVVSKSVEYKLPEDQYGNYTTDLMKVIGQTIGYSPAKLEHLVTSYSGGLYTRVARTIDLRNKKEITKSDIPVLGTLFLREPYAPRAQLSRFYEKRDLLNQKYSSGKITNQEKRLRKKHTSIARELSELWKKLPDAKTQKEKIRIYHLMKIQLEKATGKGQISKRILGKYPEGF